jgi:hypothetical protein
MGGGLGWWGSAWELADQYPQNWKGAYDADFREKEGTHLREDLLQLDTWRADYQQRYDASLAAYNSGDDAYARYEYETTDEFGNGIGKPTRVYDQGIYLSNMQKRIEALDFYDARMPEAGQVRQAQRELDATKAQIQARREDEHAKREELRRLKISPRDVKTTERGILGG